MRNKREPNRDSRNIGVSVQQYKNAIMFNLKVITFMFMLTVALDLIMPIYSNGKFGFLSIFQWLDVFILIYSLFIAYGFLDQGLPLLPWFFVRLPQILMHSFILKTSINWLFFGIVFISEIIFFALVMLDSRNYEYVREEVE